VSPGPPRRRSRAYAGERTALSYLLLGEPFSWVHVGGMAAVLVGIAATVYDDLERPR
jgi:drug/metabolite transporter (DMT)-like permease